MIDINELRRLAQAATPGPDGVSLSWITLLQDFQQGASPAVITELLDRLEAAESDALEQARLNGMGSEREAALLAKLEAAEKERDNANASAAGIALQAETLQAERDHARAGYERTVRILTDIHALLYPPRFTDQDGRTLQFKSPLAKDQMQELSDRIRALLDRLEAVDATMKAPPNSTLSGRIAG